MKINYDPGDPSFWQAIQSLPGFPKEDVIPLQTMIFESDAIYRIPEVLQRLGIPRDWPILAVMDPTPMKRGSSNLKQLVCQVISQAGWEVEPLTLDPDKNGQVHTDMPHIETVKSHLSSQKAVISVGSGVVTDITKHACYLYEKETGNRPWFIVFQTANSVSAYSSSMAPVFLDGVKRTLPSRYPDALVCDLETLVDAPQEMTVAGVGDMLAIYTSFPDWYLAHCLGMDANYSELPNALLENMYAVLAENASAIRTPTAEGMAVLAKLITLGGLAMSLSHATTPMSGYEHVFAHVLDLINEMREIGLAQHGTQVSLAEILLAEAYQIFLTEFEPDRVDLAACFPDEKQMEKQVKKNFAEIDPSGKAGEECWKDYQQKLTRWHDRKDEVMSFLKNWSEMKQQVCHLTRPPTDLVALMKKVDGPIHFKELVPPFGEAEVKFSFLNAPLMRNRLTMGDLFIFFGWDRQELWKRVWAKTQ